MPNNEIFENHPKGKKGKYMDRQVKRLIQKWLYVYEPYLH